MSFDDFEDDDNEFELFTQLNLLKENRMNQTIEMLDLRTEKINKLRLEEENIKATYESKMKDLEEKMHLLMNTSDEELFKNNFNNELNELESQFNALMGRKVIKNRSALGIGLRIGDQIKMSMDDDNEWLCECIGIEKKGLFGVLQSPKNERFQGQQFKSLNKIFQLFLKTNGKTRRSIYNTKHVEWIRNGKSLGCFQ